MFYVIEIEFLDAPTGAYRPNYSRLVEFRTALPAMFDGDQFGMFERAGHAGDRWRHDSVSRWDTLEDAQSSIREFRTVLSILPVAKHPVPGAENDDKLIATWVLE